MPAYISFCTPKAAGTASGVHQVRKTVSLAVGQSTAVPDVVNENEFVIIGNTEAGAILAAWGQPAQNPDATVNGVLIPAGGVSYPIYPRAGSIFNVKAAS